MGGVRGGRPLDIALPSRSRQAGLRFRPLPDPPEDYSHEYDHDTRRGHRDRDPPLRRGASRNRGQLLYHLRPGQDPGEPCLRNHRHCLLREHEDYGRGATNPAPVALLPSQIGDTAEREWRHPGAQENAGIALSI